jgi:hypothetical protein
MEETKNQQELESINSELFHSFDPNEASGIIGGARVIRTRFPTGDGGTAVDTVPDVLIIGE